MTDVPTDSTAHRVLSIDLLNPALVETLRSRHGADVLPPASEQRDRYLHSHGSEVRVIACSGRSGVSRALMGLLPGLQAIVNHGVGLDATDVAAARERGIALANTPDVLTRCVADVAVGLYLAARQRAGLDDLPVRNRTVGILGLGRIGSAVAARLGALRASVRYCSRTPKDAPFIHHADIVSLARACDDLIVAAPGGSDTDSLVAREALDALGPGVLVNIARASVVDQEEMIGRLADGRLAAAGLDVFAHEPQVGPRLLDLPTVVLQPHVGSATGETRADIAELVLANVDAWLRDGRLLTPVP